MAVVNGKHIPRKRFGQHFLINEHIADRIVESASIEPDDTVLEIGPGKGILTERLIGLARTVIAVEIDRDLSALLRSRFGRDERFRLIESDILTLDPDELFRDVSSRIKVVSNIPYNISAPIIEFLIRNRAHIAEAVIMVQKEVAERFLADPGSKKYGLTTLNLALCARGRKIMEVKPGAFKPEPKVMSTVISLVLTEQYHYPLVSETVFRTLTGIAFRQRRKMLRNTLIPFFVSNGITKQQALDILLSAGIDPKSRPESVDVSDFVKICNAFATQHSGSTAAESRQ